MAEPPDRPGTARGQVEALGPAGAYVAARLKQIRQERGLTLAQLAARLDTLGRPLLLSALSKIEQRQRRVDVDDLLALASALDVSPMLLLYSSDAAAGAPTRLTELAGPDDPGLPAAASSIISLFTRLFAIGPAERDLLRRQESGMQFGPDIVLESSVVGSPLVRCHVEYKNLGHPVTIKDIAEKLLQQEAHYPEAGVDHWILVSPHQDPSNELHALLDAWARTGQFPFSVQVWSPESGVCELFALEPPVFEAVYGQPPSGDLRAAAEQSLAIFRGRLAPRLRIDEVWQRYLRDPRALCFVNEDGRHFDELYGDHLPLRAVGERGVLLDGTLMDNVVAWMGDDDGSSVLLLLAGFGEGKSVFTYCLARNLCAQFLAAPDGQFLPLRIPLRDFRAAGSARGLLERRLGEIGATLAEWRMLTHHVRTLVILDGFDEMTTDLSPDAITANLRDIRSCLTELSGSKVLITSRQQLLESSREWTRTLDRMGDPLVMRISAGPRSERVRYLEQYAAAGPTAQVLARLRSLYDPIGLAAKPLFLEMVKESLHDLPADAFNVAILYDTYVVSTLRRKIEMLVDPDDLLLVDELVENLKAILEDIAVQLHEAGHPYIYLRDYHAAGGKTLAELLWRMRDKDVPGQPFDANADHDAASRVGIRSLLTPVPAPDPGRWPVDFFHKSMREYFVARAIVRGLHSDPDGARRILSAAPLPTEITRFAAILLQQRPDRAALAILDGFTRLVAGAHLASNAITLLAAARGAVPALRRG